VPGRPALATRMSTSPASAASFSAAPASARSADSTRCPSPGSSAASASSASLLRPLRESFAPRAAIASEIARPRPPVAPVSRAVWPASSIPSRKLAAPRSDRSPMKREEFGMKVRKATKCWFSMSIRPGNRLHCPPFRITETPNPASQEAPRERGNHVFGANPPDIGRGRRLLSAPARQLTP
jgi:hypothetical protein